MNRGEFPQLKNFKYEEIAQHYKLRSYSAVDAECEINKINQRLFVLLQKLIERVNSPIVIEHLTDGNHVAGSYHYKGEAIDFHLEDQKIHPNRVLQEAVTLGFMGIGWYPDAKWPRFHLDIGNRKGVKLWQQIDGMYRPIIGEGSK